MNINISKNLNIFCLVNFAPGIWLISLFDKKVIDDISDCSGDYNRSFIYMLIAQINYFIWPFFLLCLFNLLIIINICKRTKKMSNQLINSNETRKSLLNNEQTKKSLTSAYSPIMQSKRLTVQQFNETNKSFKFFFFF